MRCSFSGLGGMGGAGTVGLVMDVLDRATSKGSESRSGGGCGFKGCWGGG